MKKNNKIKIYVVGRNTNYINFFIKGSVELVHKLENAEIVLFTGGEDVHPSLYNCAVHPTTGSNIYRDKEELDIYNKAIKLPNIKLLLGICRGSQFLCVANGGMLVQNVRNHAIRGMHPIINDFGDSYLITSTHHQMQYPYNLPVDKYKILYWSHDNYSDIHEGDKIRWGAYTKEPEIVLYNTTDKIKSLAIQGHPEMMPADGTTNKMINKTINTLLSY